MVVPDGNESPVVDKGDDHQIDHRKGEKSWPLVGVGRVVIVGVVFGVEGEYGDEEEGE